MNDPLVNTDSSQKITQERFEKKPDKKLEGFDFIRAIFSVIVVAIHADFFILGEILVASTLVTLLRANVGYIAVPVFLQISLFLFYSKSEKLGIQYFVQKRLPKLGFLYAFWLISKIVFDFLFKGGLEAAKQRVSSLRTFMEVIVSGDNSPFYFLFSLIFLTALTEMMIGLFRKLKNPSIRVRVTYWLLFSSCVLVFLFSTIDLIASNFEGASEIKLIGVISHLGEWHYNPLNFLPYIFTTAIIVQDFDEGKLKKITSRFKLKLYSLLALFLTFTILEWSLLEELVHYARVSIVFGSWLLMYLALLSTRKPPASIKFLSSCSLGIYVLHPFFTHIFFPVNANYLLALSQFVPGLDAIAKFLIALTGSILLTLVFKKIKGLRRFV